MITIMSATDRRKRSRRQDDVHVMTPEQYRDLLRKVDYNYDANLRGEHMETRLQAVEKTVKELCSRITRGMWAMIVALIAATGSLIAAIYQLILWIQDLISQAVSIT